MGSFEHIEAPICADVVEAVAGIAALHIEPEGFAEAVGAALVGMAGDAVFIRTHENRIVVIGVFIQQLLSGKVRHNAPVDIPVLDQIGIDPAHIGIGRRKDKGFGRLIYPFLGRGIDRSHLTPQKHGHRLRIAEVIKALHEADGVAAPLLGMIVPLVAADGDAMVSGQPFLSAGGKELFAAAAKKLLQINGGGSLLLFICEMNVSRHRFLLLHGLLIGYLLLMIIRLAAHGHPLFRQPLAPFGINANPCRIARRHGIVPEDPAHVMEQLGCRQHDGRISELVKAVKEELGIRIALGSGAGEPIPGLLPILFHIPAQEIQLAQWRGNSQSRPGGCR